jgi:predicted permease
VLSHALWMRRFGGDPQIVGHAVQINSRTATVIGVTAAGFRGTEPGIVPEFWIPFSMMNEVEARRGPVTQNRQRYWLTLVARLRPDVEPQAARAELATIERQLTAEHGRNDRGFHLEPVGKIDPRLRRFAVTGFSLALAITVLVLLTACTNVANLLLGRAAARRREIAARMALGAGRRRLVRQFLTESLLLAGLGGVGGWIVARYASSLLGLVRTPFGWPLDLSFAPDARMVLFSLGLSLVTGLAFGLMPALKSTRADIVAELKADPNAPKRNRSRLRHGLVVVQVAVCTVLLVCMGLFLRSLQSARGMDVGMTTGNLALLAFDPSLNLRPDAQSRQLLRDILTKAQGVSGVESATMTSAVPLTLIISNSNFVLAERAKDPAVQRVRSDIYAVGPRFFATLGIPFLAGEDVHDDPPGHARPAIPAVVNEAFARAAFAGGSPIGARILGDGKALDIVGVVATVKSRSIAESPRPAIYLPILSEYSARDTPLGTTLIVKTRTDPSATMTPLREAIRTVDPSLAVFDVRTMEDQVRSALILPRLMWAVSAIAGCIGLVLAIGGVYGVISFAVARRRREIGIRLAIGARPVEVLMMILKQGAALALAGIVLGAAAALLVTRFSASLLYGVSPTDRVTFIAVPILLLAVSIVACLLPARAAARLDPVDVLRAD